MIKITGGVYGLRNKRGSVTYKTERDEPFSLPPDEEERLVRRGVAEYVVTLEPETSDTGEQDEGCALSEDMKLADLKAIASEQGLNCSKMRSKAEVIEAIRDAADESEGTEGGVDAEDSVDAEDDVPELGAAEPEA